MWGKNSFRWETKTTTQTSCDGGVGYEGKIRVATVRASRSYVEMQVVGTWDGLEMG